MLSGCWLSSERGCDTGTLLNLRLVPNLLLTDTFTTSKTSGGKGKSSSRSRSELHHHLHLLCVTGKARAAST